MARNCLALAIALLAPIGGACAFSQGAPICEVNTLPLVEMSPTLASPPPTGWTLAASMRAYVPGRPLRVRVQHADPGKRARGALVFAKRGPTTGAGSFALPPGGAWQYIPAPAECGEWALSHTSGEPKAPADMQWDYSVAAPVGSLILRAFLIEDCAQPAGGCRDQQALTPVLVLPEAIALDGFE